MDALRFQIVSDLHLEFRKSYEDLIKPSAPFLLLCGDIMVCGSDEEFKTFTEFINYICKSFQCVIHIAGNHEYYSSGKAHTYQSITKRLKAFSKGKKKYHFLHNSIYKFTFNGQRFVIAGTTLWSNITGGKDADIIKDHMNDYNYIYFEGKTKTGARKMKVLDMIGLHIEATNFIKKTINACKKNNIKCIMMTHHKPYVSNSKNVVLGYETDMTMYMGDPIILWCHGHIHEAKKVRINDTIVISNPLGYPVQTNTRYKSNCVVSFTS